MLTDLGKVKMDLRSNFCSEWDYSDNQNSVTLIRDTGDHKETIRVSKNDVWDVSVKIMDRERQLYTPASYDAHHERKLLPRHISMTNKIFNVLMKHFCVAPTYTGNFKFGTLVEKESCNIGKKHNHFYITRFVSLSVSNVEDVMRFIDLRYEFFNIR